MADGEQGKPVSVPVQILGKEYIVACPEEERADLLRSAEILDRRMRQVRDRGVIGNERIAVMAALNLSHEMLGVTERARQEEALTLRLRSLQKKIDTVLQKSAQLEL